MSDLHGPLFQFDGCRSCCLPTGMRTSDMQHRTTLHIPQHKTSLEHDIVSQALGTETKINSVAKRKEKVTCAIAVSFVGLNNNI